MLVMDLFVFKFRDVRMIFLYVLLKGSFRSIVEVRGVDFFFEYIFLKWYRL